MSTTAEHACAKEGYMEPIDFYNANATNIVNVPRPGHPEDPSGIAGVRRVMEAQYFADNAPVMSLADACDFAKAYAHSRITSLAEEAEREPASIWKSLPQCFGYPSCDGDLAGSSHQPGCPLFGKPEPTPAERVAAWLRQKAEER
jgi:hypothetical protein